MKRFFCLLLVCLLLTGCGKIRDPGETAATPTGQTAAVQPSETNPSPSETTAAAEPSTEATTAPAQEESGILYEPVDPYPIPIANPEKDIYDAPDGNYLCDFNTVGYYTIVEQAKDANGYTWGRLSTGEGWTLVYQQILPELELFFASGVGAWGTNLKLSGNGKYSGAYRDSDMGDVGEGYPNGTCYVCRFDGAFRVTDIGAYTVSLELTKLKDDYEEGKVWMEDGIRFVSSYAYGLHGGTDYVLYTPDAPVGELPEELHYWWYDIPLSGTLGCYALYCPETGCVFFAS